MRLYRSMLAAVAVFLTAASLSAQNQAPPPAPFAEPAVPAAPARAKPVAIPLELQIVISRYQGEKRISSMPYILAVNTNGTPAQLNMGADVAVPSTTFTPADPAKAQPLVSFNYRNIGTSIVCGATTTTEEGRFEVNINVDDSSVFLNDENTAGASTGRNTPAFRSFKSRNTLLLRDGQTRQYTAATDRVSGETIRIDVTMKIVK